MNRRNFLKWVGKVTGGLIAAKTLPVKAEEVQPVAAPEVSPAPAVPGFMAQPAMNIGTLCYFDDRLWQKRGITGTLSW